MRIFSQYQTNGGSPPQSRDVTWLEPDGESEREYLTTFMENLKAVGVQVGWTGVQDEMAIIIFPKP